MIRRRRTIRHAATASGAAAVLLCFACGNRAPQPASLPRPAPPRATIADEFITTFWCGPPLAVFDDGRAREIREAEFNLVGASCEGAVTPRLNLRALEIAHRHGLRMLIKDARISVAQELSAGWREKASRAIGFYKHRPGLAGFFLADEPSGARNPDISAMRRRIRREAPGKIGYVNLLPDYAFLGAEDYREHVEAYLFETQPDILSYDHYPFLLERDRPSYFENLSMIRELALEYRVPFMTIVQLMPHADYRDVTYGELSWQVFHALAFGARGISYFAYWTPSRVPDNLAYRFRDGIIEAGLPTEHYHQVAKLNRLVRALAGQTEGLTSVGVWDSRGRFGANALPLPFAGIDGGPITIGSFAGSGGRRAALVVNQNYRESITVAPTFSTGVTAETFDPISGEWTPLPAAIDLPPGAAHLLRWSSDQLLAVSSQHNDYFETPSRSDHHPFP